MVLIELFYLSFMSVCCCGFMRSKHVVGVKTVISFLSTSFLGSQMLYSSYSSSDTVFTASIGTFSYLSLRKED